MMALSQSENIVIFEAEIQRATSNLLLRALGVKKAAAYLCPIGALPKDNCEVRMDKATKRPIFNPFDVPFYTLQGTSGCFPKRVLWLAPA
jgi:hypothetical protein